MSERAIIEIQPSRPSRDGDQVSIQRVSLMGHAGTDPVLLIDELRSEHRDDFSGGFPPHPHRGMQTLTYLKRGGIVHEDSLGNRGEISGGGVQWMSAGRGVIHSEMPTLDTHGLHGFQLWFNLPAANKMDPPRYRDIGGDALPAIQGRGFAATLIAGHWRINGVSGAGPLTELAPLGSLVDLTIEPGSEVTLDTGEDDTALAYLYDGAIVARERIIDAGNVLITGAGSDWSLLTGDTEARLLVMSGRPIREPVVGYGPFVMNTREEIDRAITDYQRGTFL
ncbi:pirin family protein [Luminiphilus syltensis NOR5-1B]|uniref:Pirin family protein n=1 Tax=Luminiphilus syltensis NOR5-1B TaxID=565045 RepID=B8KW27_9GAMM|nr:pirin family protein [Luminiphilus syltensis]EED36073.1 pirin family protein [Luminiphilus syltensis NOR5-1B]